MTTTDVSGATSSRRRATAGGGADHQLQPHEHGPHDHGDGDDQRHERRSSRGRPVHQQLGEGAVGAEIGIVGHRRRHGVGRSQGQLRQGDHRHGDHHGHGQGDGPRAGQPAQVRSDDGTDRARHQQGHDQEGHQGDHGLFAVDEPRCAQIHGGGGPDQGDEVADQPPGGGRDPAGDRLEEGVGHVGAGRAGSTTDDAAADGGNRWAAPDHDAATLSPWLKKKLMMRGAPPISRAARPDTITPRRPL